MTLRKSWTPKELTMRSILYNHVTSTFITYNISYLIFYLYILKFLFRTINWFFKVWIKILNNLFPLHITICHTIKKRFHISCEINIYYLWKCLYHGIIDSSSKLCNIKILLFLCYIMSCYDSWYSRRISTWTSYSKFF